MVWTTKLLTSDLLCNNHRNNLIKKIWSSSLFKFQKSNRWILWLGETYQNILIILPHHQDDTLGVGQVWVVDHVQALGCVLFVSLKITYLVFSTFISRHVMWITLDKRHTDVSYWVTAIMYSFQFEIKSLKESTFSPGCSITQELISDR